MTPHVPDDFWTRLALLDQCCEITVYSAVAAGAQQGGRFWTANARRRDDPTRFVEVSGATMLDAMSRLLLAAEAQRLTE